MTITFRKGEFGLRRAKWKCDICGKIDFWRKGEWFAYSSVNMQEACPEDIPSACSKECQVELTRKIEEGVFELPVLRMDGFDMRVSRKRKGY